MLNPLCLYCLADKLLHVQSISSKGRGSCIGGAPPFVFQIPNDHIFRVTGLLYRCHSRFQSFEELLVLLQLIA